jgi:glycosyltransferase involved in cell wall biosynthesis
MNILFLSRWFPFPANNGSKLRIHNLLRGLSRHHSITLLSFVEQPVESAHLEMARSLCADVRFIPWREFAPHSLRARLGVLSLKPRSVVDTFSSEMAHAISTVLDEQKFDVVVASQSPMAAYRPYFKNIPALFEEVEIGLAHGRANSSDMWQSFRHGLTWLKLRIYLSGLLNSFDALTVASEQEKQLILENFRGYKKQIVVIPNCVNVDEYRNIQSQPVPASLIFPGSFRYHANYDAMVWFVRDVFPRVLEHCPEARLIITGDHADLPLPSMKNVTLTGYVDDIKTMIASSTLSIAPLLSGGGTRLKILEAMAVGTPVVATAKGAEGLPVRSGEHLLIADQPELFADCVIKMLKDEQLRKKIAGNAERLVTGTYDWPAVMPRFLQLIEGLAR